MIRFNARGAYLLSVPQGRTITRDGALISYLRNNRMLKTKLENKNQIIRLKVLCTHMHGHTCIQPLFIHCNGLLYGLPDRDYEITKLQRVQNAAARLLTSSRKYAVLQELHWLPVSWNTF